MEMVADRLWLAADGKIEPFEGDMDDYAKLVLDRARVAARAPTQVAVEAPPPPPPPAPRQKVPTGNARRRAESAEAALARASQALAEIDRHLADPEVSQDAAHVAEWARKRAAAHAALEAAEAEWMEAHDAYEALRADG
jgi:ATP-binding cassette subfamily F protein 3